VSEHTDKIVRVEMSSYDFYSITYPGYDRHVSVAINRPEITLLFRFFGQIRRYASLFGASNETAEPGVLSEI